MKRVLILAAACLAAGPMAFAGSEQIIKQRAKDLRDQNNARQGVAPAQPAHSTASATSVGAVQPVTPQQMAFTKLEADLEPIKAGSQATPQQKQKVASDFLALAQGPKPSSTTVTKLTELLAAGLMAKPLPASQRSRLLQSLNSALNSASLAPTQAQAIVSDVQSIFQTGGLDVKEASRIGEALQSVMTEIRKPAGK